MKTSFTFGFLIGMTAGIFAVKYVDQLTFNGILAPLEKVGRQFIADGQLPESVAAKRAVVETAAAKQIRTLRERLAEMQA